MAIKRLDDFNHEVEVTKEVLSSMPINNAKNVALYKNKISEFTQTIEVVEYNGSRLNSKYHCKLCVNIWEQRSDHFKGHGTLHYVCPKCKR